MTDEDVRRRRLGEIIRLARLAENLGVTKASERAHISKNTWDRAEAGERVRQLSLNKICRILGFPNGAFNDFLRAGGPEPVAEIGVVEVESADATAYGAATVVLTPEQIALLEDILHEAREQRRRKRRPG